MAPVQQAQHERLLLQHFPASQPDHQHPQRWGSARWAAAVASFMVVLALAATMLLITPGHELSGVDDLDVDLGAADFLLRQLHKVDSHQDASRYLLHVSAGQLLRDEGRYAEAVEQFASALEMARTATDEARVREMLGLTQLRQGQLKDAQHHLETVVVKTRSSAENIISVHHTLADVHAEMGHLEEALRLYTKAFNLAGEREEAIEMVLLAAGVGEVWARRGNSEEAFAWISKAKSLYTESRWTASGVDEVLGAKVSSFMAAAYHLQGQIPRALRFYQKALEEQQQALRPHHPDLVATQLSMARALYDNGDLKGSLSIVAAVEQALRSSPQEGPDLSRAVMMKSLMQRASGDLESAHEAILETIGLQAACFGGQDHPEVAVALNSYGSILHDLGRGQDARDKYEEALSINLRTVGELHPETAATYSNLGALYNDAREDIVAEEHYAKCLKIQLDTVGAASPEVANTYNNLATVIFRQGSAEEAGILLHKALEVMDAAGIPAGNPNRATYEKNLREVRMASIVVPGFPQPKGMEVA